MIDVPQDQSPESGAPRVTPAADLGRSYETLLEQQGWESEAASPPLYLPPILGGDTEGEPASSSEALGTVGGAAGSDPPLPMRIIEAMLFVGGPPLTVARACEAIRDLTESQFAEALEALNRDYRRQGRPYAIMAQGQGQVLTLRPRYRPLAEKLFGSVREVRLSTAALDVLALVAYRQPATKQEVDSLRGLDSGAILRQLVRRGLIAVAHRGSGGDASALRGVAYGTTARFLEMFALKSIEDLPQTQDLQKL